MLTQIIELHLYAIELKLKSYERVKKESYAPFGRKTFRIWIWEKDAKYINRIKEELFIGGNLFNQAGQPKLVSFQEFITLTKRDISQSQNRLQKI